ncbi:hypothetical protein WAI453_007669 [Rhynchosporium graminicola]
MADSPLDPQLTSRGDALPVRNIDDVASESENEEGANEGQNDARKKRQKLNLWKCRQCREARKKCLPEGRVWPEKCQRCLQHRPGELECSKPEVNNRTRGKNVPKGKDTTPVPSTAVIIPDRATPIQNASVEDAVKVSQRTTTCFDHLSTVTSRWKLLQLLEQPRTIVMLQIFENLLGFEYFSQSSMSHTHLRQSLIR